MIAIIGIAALLAGGYFYVWPLVFPSVAVVRPERGPAVQAVYATGTVEATVMLPLAARSAARLVALNVDEGASVKKDAVLAQLEDADLQRTIEQLQAAERFARKEFARAAAMVRSGVVSQAAFEQAKANLDAAAAAAAKARTEAGYMRLTAPADGLVIKRDGEIGQMIPANQPVFWLSCCAPLRIATEVDEEDIAQVAVGQPVLIRADAFPGRIFHGAVQSITPKGDPVDRSYRVRIGFTEDTPLRIGMTAETNIVINETKDALLVPASAVVKDKVWLARDGRLVEQAVTLGAKGADKIEIRSGVAMEDSVVLKPDAKLRDGRKIRVTAAKQKTEPER